MKNSKLFLKSFKKFINLYFISNIKDNIIIIITCSCVSLVTSIIAIICYKRNLQKKQIENNPKGELKMVEINENDIKLDSYDIEEFNNDTDENDLNNNDLE